MKAGNFISALCVAFALAAPACKKRVTKLDIPTPLRLGGEPQEEVPDDKIDTSVMFVVILSVGPEKVGKHHGLKMEIHRTPEPDYYEFYICKEGDSECRPQKSSPGTFTLGEHRYDDPPTGKVKGAIRACVSQDLAFNPEMPCGPWENFSGVDMPESEDPRLKGLFLAREQLKEGNKAECEKFRAEVSSFLDDARSQGRVTPEQEEQVINMLRMNDLNCEISSSILFVEAKDDVETQPATEDKGWSTASKVMFGIGAGLTAFGALKVGYDVWKMRTPAASGTSTAPKLRAGRLRLVGEEDEGLGLAGREGGAGPKAGLGQLVLVEGGKVYEGASQLEAIIKELEKLEPRLPKGTVAGKTLDGRITDLRGLLNTMRGIETRLKALGTQMERALENGRRLRGELEAAQRELDEARKAVAAAGTDTAARTAAAARLKTAGEEVGRLGGAKTAADAEKAQLEEQVKAARAAATANEARQAAALAALQRELATARSATEEANAKAAAAEAALGAETAKIAGLEAKAAEASAAAANAQQELAAARKEAGGDLQAAEERARAAEAATAEARAQAAAAEREKGEALRAKEAAEAAKLKAEEERAAAERAVKTAPAEARRLAQDEIAAADGRAKAAAANAAQALADLINTEQRANAAEEKARAANERLAEAQTAHAEVIARLKAEHQTTLGNLRKKVVELEAKAAAVKDARAALEARVVAAEAAAARAKAEADSLRATDVEQKANLDAMRADIARQAAELARARAATTAAEEKARAAEERVRTEEEAKAVVEGDVAKANKEAQAAKAELARISAATASSTRDLEKRLAEAEAARGRAEGNLVYANGKLDGANDRLAEARREYEATLAKKDAEIAKLRAINAMYQWSLEYANGTTGRAEAEVERLKGELATAAKTAAGQEVKITALEGELRAAGGARAAEAARLQGELEAARAQHAEALGKQARAQEDLRRQLEEMRAENERLTEALSQSERLKTAFSDALRDTQLRVADAIREQNTLLEQNRALRQQLDAARLRYATEAARLEIDLIEKEKAVAEAKAASKQDAGKIARLEEQVGNLNRRFIGEMRLASDLGGQVAELEHTNAVLTGRLEGSEAARVALQGQLDEVNQRLATQAAATDAERAQWESERAALAQRLVESAARRSRDTLAQAEDARGGRGVGTGDTSMDARQPSYGTEMKSGGIPMGGIVMMLGGMSLMTWAIGIEAAALAEGTGDDPFLERIEDFKTKINEISGNIDSNNALINSATVNVLFYLSENQ